MSYENEQFLFNTEISTIINSKLPISFVNENAKFTKKKDYNLWKIAISLLFIICFIQLVMIIHLMIKKKEFSDKLLIKNIKENINSKKNNINQTLFINKTEIHISMSLDNNRIYPTLVSMTSALENNDNTKNILVYYLLLSHDFNVTNLEIFESLKYHYDFKIKYFYIPNIFTDMDKWRESDTIYYKLLIPLMFPELERMIFLDGDTLIFKDISEMYNLPFNGNYILGYPFHTPYIIDKLGINSKYYINGRVILLNIPEIRKYNKDIELLKYTADNNKKVLFLEQDTLNYIFYGKIGFLPLKYGIYLYGNFTSYMENLRVSLNLTELKNAIDDPSIVHFCCCNPKIWNKTTEHERGFNQVCKKYQKKFYYYANKTDYYFDIYSKYMK